MSSPNKPAKVKKTLLFLPAELTIAHVAEVWQDYIDHKDTEGEIALDASDVNHVDAAGLQCVVALLQDMRTQKRAWSWFACTNALASAAALAGVAATMGMR
jgi:anti-anti-sigma regulatory factor